MRYGYEGLWALWELLLRGLPEPGGAPPELESDAGGFAGGIFDGRGRGNDEERRKAE